MNYIAILLLQFIALLSFIESKNETLQARSLDIPVLRFNYPHSTPGKSRTSNTSIQKEDPADVEEFPVNEDSFVNGRDPGYYPNDDGPFGDDYPYYPGTGGRGGPDPFYPNGVGSTDLEGFTARKVANVQLFPGQRLRFLDTVTNLGYGWNNRTSEFICRSPGIFYFTFTACGDRNRHFRITLKHNNVGVVSAYGDINGFQMASNSALLRLFPRDRVYLQLDEGSLYEVNTFTGRAYNTFSGFRVL